MCWIGRQLLTTGNNLQRAANSVSPTVRNYHKFTADKLWISVIFGHWKSLLKKRGQRGINLGENASLAFRYSVSSVPLLKVTYCELFGND